MIVMICKEQHYVYFKHIFNIVRMKLQILSNEDMMLNFDLEQVLNPKCSILLNSTASIFLPCELYLIVLITYDVQMFKGNPLCLTG